MNIRLRIRKNPGGTWNWEIYDRDHATGKYVLDCGVSDTWGQALWVGLFLLNDKLKYDLTRASEPSTVSKAHIGPTEKEN